MSHRFAIAVAALFTTVLVVAFGAIYFDDHSFGAWGDDSPGYIYLTGRMFNGEPLVYQDDLAQLGIEFFGDEKLARWLTPTHHLFIAPDGTLASKYPIGASLVMLAAAKLGGSLTSMYTVIPLLAALNVGLVYLLALALFPKERFKHAIGVGAGVMLGLAELYYDYAIAQPMREIPSIFFVLLTMLLFVLGVRAWRGKRPHAAWYGADLIAASALSMGMAFNIRETMLVVIPALVVYGVISFWDGRASWKSRAKKLWPVVATFTIALVLAALPTAWNSYNISQEKVPFKARDTGSVVVLSNIGHIESFSFSNIYDNQGKFRPGKGSLHHYWDVMNRATPLPYLFVFVAFGLWYLWKRQRSEGVLLALWALGVLGVYALWINPYSRYILPLFPALLLVAAYGAMGFFRWFVPTVVQQRWLRGLLAFLVAASLVAGYVPVATQVEENLSTDVYRFKAIGEHDLAQLEQVAATIQDRGDEKPVLLFGGDWQYGTSETLEAHTGLKTIRFPLDQRFEQDRDEVAAFFELMREEGYTVYAWADATASGAYGNWLSQYERETLLEMDYTFQSGVRVYAIGDRGVE